MDTYLRASFRFMSEHAGYSVPPGRAACAIALARAELRAASIGLRFQWSHEPDIETTASDEQVERIAAGATVYLQCLAFLGDEVVGALGGIEVTSDADPYCRVVEAELASEALHEMSIPA